MNEVIKNIELEIKHKINGNTSIYFSKIIFFSFIIQHLKNLFLMHFWFLFFQETSCLKVL